jgi:endonuclease-8
MSLRLTTGDWRLETVLARRRHDLSEPPRRSIASWPAKRSRGFESVYPASTRVADDRPIVGRTIESVSARGKHLLIAFLPAISFFAPTMRMNGSWHIYPAGARWQRPAHEMRVLVGTRRRRRGRLQRAGRRVADSPSAGAAPAVASARSGSALRCGRVSKFRARRAVDRLEVIRRLRARGGDTIGDALLNQRVVAGIGNVFKSEILFVARIDPFAPVSSLSDGRAGTAGRRCARAARRQRDGRSQTLSTGDRPPDHAQSRSTREALGVRERRQEVPPLRGADSLEEDRGPTHV